MKKPKIIAHRGFWNIGNCAENSLESLRNAQQLKVYGSEFDVRLTSDEIAVIHHDPEINGFEIAKTDFKTLSQQQLFNGETIPTLKNYLLQGKKEKEVRLIMELKDLGNQEEELRLVEVCSREIRKTETENQIDFISFSRFIGQEIKDEFPQNPFLYLNGDLSPKELKKLNFDGFDYEDQVLLKHPEWISVAKELELTTNCWTVDDIDLFRWLREEEIDFVTTNIPAVLLKI